MQRTPPTLRELLQHSLYREFFKRPVKTHPTSTGKPWMVVGITPDGRFGHREAATYREAFAHAKELLSHRKIRDVSIVSLNTITPEPKFAGVLMDVGDAWCGRCRRPTVFRRYGDTHPAMKHLPVIVPNQHRCYFCGIQQSEYHMGHIVKPVKPEKVSS